MGVEQLRWQCYRRQYKTHNPILTEWFSYTGGTGQLYPMISRLLRHAQGQTLAEFMQATDKPRIQIAPWSTRPVDFTLLLFV